MATTNANAIAQSGNQSNSVIVNSEMTNMKKKTYKAKPVYQVCRMAKAQFNRQITKRGEVKVDCLNVALTRCTNLYPDAQRFWNDFKAERDRLLDSGRFSAACKARDLEPRNVADHVVFEGKGQVRRVLEEGLQALGENVQMFNCPLWQDTLNLFVKEGSDE